MKKFCVIFSLISFSITSCTHLEKTNNYPQVREEYENKRIGKLSGEEGIVLFGARSSNKSIQDAISVNSYLWRATLDVIYLAKLPIISADPFSGLVITDWYMSDPNINERLKLNIMIIGATLRADAVKVSAFKQIKNSHGQWLDHPVNPQFATIIEDKILLKAREIKVKTS